MQIIVEKKKNRSKSEAGFSLNELLISMVIFMIFMAAVYGLLLIGNMQKTTVNTQIDVIKNVRLSLNTIGRDAVNAGLGFSRVGGFAPDNITNLRLGIPADADTTHDLITAVIAGNEINDNLALTAGKTDVISFAFRDLEFNNGAPIKLTAAASFGANGVTITTAAGETVNSKPYDLYLISDGTRTALGTVTAVPVGGQTLVFEAGAADPLGINGLYSGPIDTRSKLVSCLDFASGCMDYTTATAKKVNWISYRLSIDGVLIRTVFGNNNAAPIPLAADQIQTQPIAYNIQNLQVRYLLDDGTVSDDPSNGGINPSALNKVVQIDVVISARYTITENGVTLNKVVDLKSTFSTKNLNYDIG